jgi:hypothetical protein
MPKLSDVEFQLLSDTAAYLEIISGSRGTKVYGSSGAVAQTGLDVKSISIREDATVFSTLVCYDGTTTLGFSDFYIGTTTTLKGDLLKAPPGYRFTAFTITAGSIQTT